MCVCLGLLIALGLLSGALVTPRLAYADCVQGDRQPVDCGLDNLDHMRN